MLFKAHNDCVDTQPVSYCLRWYMYWDVLIKTDIQSFERSSDWVSVGRTFSGLSSGPPAPAR